MYRIRNSVWRVLQICLTSHEPHFRETQSKEINNSKYIPKKRQIKRIFNKTSRAFNTGTLSECKTAGRRTRSSLVIQKRHNNIFLPPHTAMLWHKGRAHCVSSLPLSPASCRLRAHSYAVTSSKQAHANQNTVLREQSRHNRSCWIYLITRWQLVLIPLNETRNHPLDSLSRHKLLSALSACLLFLWKESMLWD